MPWITENHEGCVLTIHASPRASRSLIQGTHGDALKVRLKAPPVDGKANKELLSFLASCLDVPLRRLDLLSGETGRHKRILVHGLPAGTVRPLLEKHLAS